MILLFKESNNKGLRSLWIIHKQYTTIRDIKVGTTQYRVKLNLTGNPYFGLQSTEILNQPQSKQAAEYGDDKQSLTIPLAQLNGLLPGDFAQYRQVQLSSGSI